MLSGTNSGEREMATTVWRAQGQEDQQPAYGFLKGTSCRTELAGVVWKRRKMAGTSLHVGGSEDWELQGRKGRSLD